MEVMTLKDLLRLDEVEFACLNDCCGLGLGQNTASVFLCTLLVSAQLKGRDKGRYFNASRVLGIGYK